MDNYPLPTNGYPVGTSLTDLQQRLEGAREVTAAFCAENVKDGKPDGIERVVELLRRCNIVKGTMMNRTPGSTRGCRLALEEILRVCERAIGVGIRVGQRRGTIRARGDRDSRSGPYDFATSAELMGGGNSIGFYKLADVGQRQFDAALAACRADRNMSRSNLMRHVNARDAGWKNKTKGTRIDPELGWIPSRYDPRSAARRRELIAEMAQGGYTSQQIGQRLDMSDETVRRIARGELDLVITADVATGVGNRTRNRIDSNRIVRETIAGLAGLELGLELVNFTELDRGEVAGWLAELDMGLAALQHLNKKLKAIQE